MEKMVALVLLRLLPRGGSKFRRWFAAAACHLAFTWQTNALRDERVVIRGEPIVETETLRAFERYTLHVVPSIEMPLVGWVMRMRKRKSLLLAEPTTSPKSANQ